jgi:hypothetical protein
MRWRSQNLAPRSVHADSGTIRLGMGGSTLITSQTLIRTNDDPDLLIRIREALGLAVPSRGIVRCIGRPMFRTQGARCLGYRLDVDPSMLSGTCLPWSCTIGTRGMSRVRGDLCDGHHAS